MESNKIENLCKILKDYEKEKEYFFEKVCKILKNFSIKKRRKQLRGFNEFNFFKILGLLSDEVKHSRIIAEFLNPYGCHFQETLFLENFFEQILKVNINIEELKKIKVFVEKHIEYDGNEGRIDILLESETDVYIIENKIYASDGYNQIYKYVYSLKKEIPNKNINVIYLTLDKRDPSEKSLNGLKIKNNVLIDKHNKPIASFVNITYSDILKWMKFNLEEVKNISNLKEAISQYIFAIEDLLNIREETMNLKDYLMKNHQYILGDLLENYNEFKSKIDKECLEFIKKENLDEVIENIKIDLRKKVVLKLYEKLKETFSAKYNINQDGFLNGEKWSPLLIYKDNWKYDNNKGKLSFAIEFGQYNYNLMYYGIAKYSENIPYSNQNINSNILKNIIDTNKEFKTSNYYLIWKEIPYEWKGKIDRGVYYKEILKDVDLFVDKYYFNEIKEFVEKNEDKIDEYIKNEIK